MVDKRGVSLSDGRGMRRGGGTESYAVRLLQPATSLDAENGQGKEEMAGSDAAGL